MSLSDSELFLDFKEQRLTKAFEELINRHRKAVVNFFYRFSWNKEIAEDLSQEVFIKLALNAKRYTSQIKFKTFLYQIVRTIWIDYLRKRAITPHPISLEKIVGGDKDGCLKDIVEAPKNSPLDNIVNKEEIIMVKKALENLSDEQRLSIELALFGQLDYSEISLVMDIPIGTVKSRIKMAINYLKELMKNR